MNTRILCLSTLVLFRVNACGQKIAKPTLTPKSRYDQLAAFCKKNGLTKEADEFQRKSAALK